MFSHRTPFLFAAVMLVVIVMAMALQCGMSFVLAFHLLEDSPRCFVMVSSVALRLLATRRLSSSNMARTGHPLLLQRRGPSLVALLRTLALYLRLAATFSTNMYTPSDPSKLRGKCTNR